MVGDTKLFRRDATRLGPNRGAPFNVIFLDPPYRRDLAEPALVSAMAGGWIADEAVVALERAADEAPFAPPSGLVLNDKRRYGDSEIHILVRETPESGDC